MRNCEDIIPEGNRMPGEKAPDSKICGQCEFYIKDNLHGCKLCTYFIRTLADVSAGSERVRSRT